MQCNYYKWLCNACYLLYEHIFVKLSVIWARLNFLLILWSLDYAHTGRDVTECLKFLILLLEKKNITILNLIAVFETETLRIRKNDHLFWRQIKCALKINKFLNCVLNIRKFFSCTTEYWNKDLERKKYQTELEIFKLELDSTCNPS